jgi:hypothetical protein
MRGRLFAGEKVVSDQEGMHIVRGMHACFVDLSIPALAD